MHKHISLAWTCKLISCCSSLVHIHRRENHHMARPCGFSRQKTSSKYHVNVTNIPRKSHRLRPKHSRIRYLMLQNMADAIPKRSYGIRAVSGGFEKHFPGSEKITRKEPRKAFGPEKFSGLLRNARLGSNSQNSHTKHLPGQKNRREKAVNR